MYNFVSNMTTKKSSRFRKNKKPRVGSRRIKIDSQIRSSKPFAGILVGKERPPFVKATARVRTPTFMRTLKAQYGLGSFRKLGSGLIGGDGGELEVKQIGEGSKNVVTSPLKSSMKGLQRRYKCLKKHYKFLHYFAHCKKVECGRLLNRCRPEVLQLLKTISDDAADMRIPLPDLNKTRQKLAKHESVMTNLKQNKNARQFFSKLNSSKDREQVGGFLSLLLRTVLPIVSNLFGLASGGSQ